jgi:hypothetical protein
MFDPEKVDRYNTGCDECSEGIDSKGEWILAEAYDQLLELYKAEINSKPVVRVVAFRDQLLVFGHTFYFGVRVPDVRQETIDLLLARGRPEYGQNKL